MNKAKTVSTDFRRTEKISKTSVFSKTAFTKSYKSTI